MRAAGANNQLIVACFDHSHLWKLAVTHSRARASFPKPSFPDAHAVKVQSSKFIVRPVRDTKIK